MNRMRTASSPARQFLTGIELAVITISLRSAITPRLGERHKFLPGYAAVAVVTWLETWRAGAVVAGASLIALESALFRPADAQLLQSEVQDLASAIGFVFVAALLT